MESNEVKTVIEEPKVETPTVENQEPVAIVEEKKETEPQTPPIVPEVKEPPKPVYRKESDKTLPFDIRIIAFLESRGSNQFIKMNDFLKSLYPLPKGNEPPKWMDQGESKRLRVLLHNMQSHGQIVIKDNGHARLGTHYYEGVEQYAKHYNLNNVFIECKK